MLSARSFSEKEIENGITILRVKTLPHHNVNYLLRGVAQLLMPSKISSQITSIRHYARCCGCVQPTIAVGFSWQLASGSNVHVFC